MSLFLMSFLAMDSGSLKESPLLTVSSGCKSSAPSVPDPPPKPLLIASPSDSGEYPLLLFLHGYLLYNSFYSQLLLHIASHGFIVIAPQVYFGMLDALLASEELPEEYRDRLQDILCNDCEKKGTAAFHWLYHKCGFCGSYNTKVIKTEPNSERYTSR